MNKKEEISLGSIGNGPFTILILFLPTKTLVIRGHSEEVDEWTKRITTPVHALKISGREKSWIIIGSYKFVLTKTRARLFQLLHDHRRINSMTEYLFKEYKRRNEFVLLRVVEETPEEDIPIKTRTYRIVRTYRKMPNAYLNEFIPIKSTKQPLTLNLRDDQ